MLVFSGTFKSQQNGCRYDPISEIFVPQPISGDFLIKSTIPASAPQTWRLAGWCNQIFDFGPLTGKAYGQSHKCLLGNNFISFSGSSFYISFKPAAWIREINIDVELLSNHPLSVSG